MTPAWTDPCEHGGHDPLIEESEHAMSPTDRSAALLALRVAAIRGTAPRARTTGA